MRTDIACPTIGTIFSCVGPDKLEKKAEDRGKIVQGKKEGECDMENMRKKGR